jgi:hypothetical protein
MNDKLDGSSQALRNVRKLRSRAVRLWLKALAASLLTVRSRETDLERYLSQSVDPADLERRIRIAEHTKVSWLR